MGLIIRRLHVRLIVCFRGGWIFRCVGGLLGLWRSMMIFFDVLLSCTVSRISQYTWVIIVELIVLNMGKLIIHI